MLWEEMKSRLCNGGLSKYADRYESIEYKELYKRVHEYAKKLAGFPEKSICLIDCERKFLAGIWFLAALSEKMVPVIVNRSYGQKRIDYLIELLQPHCVIQNENVCVMMREHNNCFDEDVELILCTSGTTGKQKGVLMTGKGVIGNIKATLNHINIQSKDKVLIARPLTHCAVLVSEFLLALYTGGSIYFFDDVILPESIITISERENITWMGGTPTIFWYLSLVYEKYKKMPCYNKMIISGEVLSERVHAEIVRIFKKTQVFHAYGMSEAGPKIAILSSGEFEAFGKSVGTPLENVSAKIVNCEGKGGEGTQGEIWISSPFLMQKYFGENTSHIIDGWFNTGDIGYLSDGRLYITGRQDDMIIKAGMNIYPSEIEELLEKSTLLMETLVCRMEGKLGDEIELFVVPKKNDISHSEIMDDITEILPVCMYPKKVSVVKELPRTASGKRMRIAYE